MRQARTGGMVELTLLEVHVDVDDSEFSTAADAYAPGEKDVEAGGTPPDGGDSDDDGGGGRAAVGAVVGLLLAVLVAYTARRQFGNGDGDGGGDGR